jgi:hypothetical protein
VRSFIFGIMCSMAAAKVSGSVTVFRLFLACGCLVGIQGNFLAMNEAGRRDAGHAMSTEEVMRSLNESFDSVMGEHVGAEGDRIAAVEASIWRTFQALPKNKLGRLSPRSVRHIVHNYFSKEHGWRIEGLEPHSMQVTDSEVHNVTIMQEKAPSLVEVLLEDREQGRGLSFEDIVVMITALEGLIATESFSLLEDAYSLNSLRPTDQINEKELHDILTSYLLAFRMGAHASLDDVERHHAIKERLQELGSPWDTLAEFEQDTVGNHDYADRNQLNPFQSKSYSFGTSSEIVRDMVHSYGKWQNADCLAMKEHLMSFDLKGTGRIPLDLFYAQPDDSLYHFHESVEYLQEIGALDNSNGRMPQVRISNYVLGPTNCIARSAFYSVCCLNECEHLVNEIEGKVQAPMASPEHLLRIVAELSSSTIDAPQQLSQGLVDKIHAIADQNDGAVPLHGRLFAQWMHFAFPNECPFPQQVDSSALMPQQWADGKAIASAEEMIAHMEAGLASTESDVQSHPAAPLSAEWSHEEVLPLLDATKPSERSHGMIGDILGVAMRIAPLLVVLRLGHAGWKAAVLAHQGDTGAKKETLGHLV